MDLPRKLLIVGLLSFVSLTLIECLECSDSYDLPNRLSLLKLNEFYDKIVGGGIWHGFMGGLLAPAIDTAYFSAELTVSRTSEDTIQINYERAIYNGSCFFDDKYNGTELSRRAEFFDLDANDYIAFFSSDPDSYVWFYYCVELDGDHCPSNRTYLEVQTRENPLMNPDLRSMARDLKKATGLDTTGDGTLEFILTQGDNECVENGK